MRIRTGAVGIAAGSAALLLSALPVAAAASGSSALHAPAQDVRGHAAPVASVWVTTPDAAEQLHQRPSVAFGSTPSDNPTIIVDPRQKYQQMDGFGASITDSAATVLYRLAPTVRDQAMHRLFDPVSGIGVSFLRQPIGSSDFTAAATHYTYDDVPAGATDFALTKFSIDHDRSEILPLLRQAKRLNPDLSVMATPWSPPAWMKTGDSLIGGRLKDDPAIYDAYARYLVKFVQSYRAAGVPVDFLSVQNEPQNRNPNGYPGTDMPVRQEVKVIEALGPLLQKASPHTKILAYDHNWATHPDDVAATPPGESPETDYPYEVLASPAAKWVAGTAYHCYYGDPSAQTALHNADPDKGIWFTECSGSHGPSDSVAKTFNDTLRFHARVVAIGTTRNWAKSVVNWNIALDENGGPHNGGCDTCTGLITVLPDGTIRTQAEYDTIGHLSKFVKPGAVRIGSTSFGTTGYNGQIEDVAFQNPDGSTVLVAHNENDAPRDVSVAVGDRSFDYTMPGGSLITFTWPRSHELKSKLKQVPLDGATATASPSGETVAYAIDGDASTRWSSGTGQAPGQYLQVDLGQPTHFSRVDIDSGGNLGDYARSWTLAVSDDGQNWTTLASGAGTGQLTTVELGNTKARYLRVTATGSAGNYWSVSDLRLYR